MARQFVRLPVDQIRPSPDQPRHALCDSSIASLAESIRQYGLLSPLLVRRLEGGSFQLIAGERRLQALKRLGRREADALIVEVQNREAALMTLIENIQREDLRYFEEAEAYLALMRAHGFTQEELSRRLGKSQSCLANKLRLLKLPPAVRARLGGDDLSERHARALLKLPGEEMQLRAIACAEAEGLGVRAFEALIERMLLEKRPASPIRYLFRDHRLFLNTVLEAVRAINEKGVPATSRVREFDDRVEVVVSLPKVRALPEAALARTGPER